MVRDIVTGTGWSNPNHFTSFDGAVFFSVNTGTGYELWKTDGTGPGTVKIRTLNTSTETFAIWECFVVVGDLFYFAVTDEGIGSFGKELWKSDGTPDGTLVVKNIRPGTEGSDPNSLSEFNGLLYFRADDGTNGAELWKSDGTPEGTVMAQDLAPGSSGSNPEDLIHINGELCFAANDGTNGVELWKFDKPLTAELKISETAFDEDGDEIYVSAVLNRESTDEVRIVLSFSGTASEDEDYTLSEKTITIPAGNLEESVKLTGITDAIYEGDETVVVNIASATNAAVNTTQFVSLTIKDEGDKPTVTIYLDEAVSEPVFEEGGDVIKIWAYMGNQSSKDVAVNLKFSGTAKLESPGVTDGDYKASELILTIPAEGQGGYITLVGKKDDLREGDESVIVTIDSAPDVEIDTDVSVDLTLKDMTPPAPGIYYVDIEKGKDQVTNGNSAEADAWKTLHYAISNINQGTPGGDYTLHIAPGVYSIENGEEDADLIISKNNVTIQGANDVLISGTYEAQDWMNGITIEGSETEIREVAVKGFHESGISISGDQNIVDSCAAYENKIGITLEEIARSNLIRNGCELRHNKEAGIIISGGQNNEIYKNHDAIYDNGFITSDGYSSGAGIMIVNNAKDNQVYDNHIYSTQISDASGNTVPRQYIGVYMEETGSGNNIWDNDISGHHSGIEIADSNADVMQNRLHDNEKAICVHASKDGVAPRIWNNLIYASAEGIQHYGIFVGNDETAKAEPLIYHNTIDRGEEFGICVNKNTAPKIRYNIITNFQAGIENYGGSPVVEYNNLHGNSINYSGMEDMTGKQGNISYDPQFRNDVPYFPQMTSPCINGIPTSENDPVAHDFDGTVRPQHSGYDMGCYEYTGYSLHVKISKGVEGEISYETRCLAGENCPDPDHYRVKIEATTSSAGYQFDHWEGDLTGSENPAEIILDADKNITAVFLPIQYRVEVSVSPDDGGTVSVCSTTDTLCDISCPGDCETSYDAGSEITLTASPASEYQFDHWENASLRVCLSGGWHTISGYFRFCGKVRDRGLDAISSHGSGRGLSDPWPASGDIPGGDI